MNRPLILETLYNILYTFTDLNNPDCYDANVCMAKVYLKYLHLEFVDSDTETIFDNMILRNKCPTISAFQHVYEPYFDWQSAEQWNNTENALDSIATGMKKCIDNFTLDPASI